MLEKISNKKADSNIKMELDFSWLILALAILIGTWLILFGFLKRLVNELCYAIKLGKKRHSLPPGDMGWPLLGNTWSYYQALKSEHPENFIFNLFQRYGRTGMYKINLFGSPSVIVCAPELCRQILLDDERFKLGYSASISKLIFKGSLGSASLAEQKRIRKLATSPIKGNKAVAFFIRNIEEIVITSLNEWASISHERPIEFLSEMRKAAFKIIMDIFFGSSRHSVHIELMEKYYVDLVNGIVMSPVAINIPGFSYHTAIKARNMLGKIFQRVLNERRSMKESNQQKRRNGLIDLLIEVEDENGKKLEDVDIVDVLVQLLFAGHDSSAHGAAWAIIYLHQHSETLQKAKQEQEVIMKRRSSTQNGLSIEEIRQMVYLAKVIDETLRIANISSISFREAKADIKIQNYIIPKGWKILIYTRGVHLDPEIYSDPNKFDPSRWENHAIKPGAFIPFGGGQRICPGADLAKLEISIFLHYFLLNYKLEQLDPRCSILHQSIPKPADNCLGKIVKFK